MFRIEGLVYPYAGDVLEPDDTEAMAYRAMNERQRKIFEENLEMNLALYYPELGRFRVNIFRQRGYVGMVIRQIKVQIKTIDDLGLPQILKDIVMTKRGLVLVVGATGGKSTSLAAMIDYRNLNQRGHIISIEDPIEFVHEHKMSVITQREVADTHSFLNALKNTMRQAPDVILIGEIRDAETMEDAITFAETGILHWQPYTQIMQTRPWSVYQFFLTERHLQIHAALS